MAYSMVCEGSFTDNLCEGEFNNVPSLIFLILGPYQANRTQT